MRRSRIEIEPLTSDRWSDFATLFGPRGACGGCWCMTPRLSRREYEERKGEANRRAMKRIVERGAAPGVLAFAGGEPIGWCAFGPRSEFKLLAGSRVLAPIDDQPVFSIVCLFVAKDRRRQGVSSALIEGAVAEAKRRGARIVEAYPVDPRKESMPDVFAYSGILASYLAAGFEVVERRSPTRPIVRRAT